MTAEWVTAAPPFLVATALFVLPGLVVRLAGWNARSLGPYFLVPALSVAVVAVASNVAPVLGLSWSLAPILLVTLVAAAAAYGIRRWVGQEQIAAPTPLAVLAAVGAPALAAVLISMQLSELFGSPEGVSQTFDNIVHLNAIGLALETQNASALQIGSTSDIGFYPNAWHSFVSMAASATGVSIPTAVNATNLALGAIAWPASCVALACAFFRDRTAAIISAAALSTGFAAFPTLLMSFGVLYPNAMGYAVLPAGLAAVWWFLQAATLATRVRAGVALIVVTAGIGLGHPNAVLALFAMAVPMVLMELLLRAIAARDRRTWIVNVGIAVLLLTVGALLWKFARTGTAMSQWGPWTGTWEAVVDGLLLAPRSYAPTLGIAVLVIVGLVAAVMRPRRLVQTIPFFVALFMFVVVSGTGYSVFRDMITNPWYNDSYRLAALLPVAGIPVATMGALAIVDAVRRVTQRRSFPSLLVGIVSVVAALAMFTVAWGPNVRAGIAAWRDSYVVDADSALLTDDEAALLSRLSTETASDALILGNPWTGTSLALALSGRDVVERHIFGTRTADELYLDAHLREIDTDPLVCEAIERLGVTHVLDFGSQNVFRNPAAAADRAGLNDLTPSDRLQLVDEQGAARLYQIEGC